MDAGKKDLEGKGRAQAQTNDTLPAVGNQFQSIFENSLLVMLLVDPATGAIQDANRAACRYYGWSHSEICSKKMAEIAIGTSSCATVKEATEKSAKEDHSRSRCQHGLASGEVREVEIYSSLIVLGHTSVLYYVVHEIADGKPSEGQLAILNAALDARETADPSRVEKALRESEERYRQLFDASPDGIILIGPDERIVRANISHARMYGYDSPEDMIGIHPPQLVAPSSREYSREVIRRRMDGEDIPLVEYELVRKDGTTFYGETLATTLRNKDGTVAGYICVTRDTTVRRQAEEALQKVQKLEALGILAGGIAHDFNNLLGGIYGYIDLAAETVRDDQVGQYLSRAMDTMDRARALTLQLLTFASGGAPIRKVGPLFPFVRETALFALSGSSVACFCSAPRDLWSCNFDKNQMGQVIDNMVINAKQAMPNGGTIEIAAQNLYLGENQHAALAAGNYVKVSIKDCGVGIPKEILHRIFDPFYTTKAAGHGLGLATCYSIVTRHGGFIDVESEPGKGSTFCIYLPATKGSDLLLEKQPKSEHRGNGIFLVMDDQKFMRDAIGAMLGSFGYTVVHAMTGKDAVDLFAAEMAANHRVVGMIFDLTIPGNMGGKEAIGEIRKLSRETPVFVASGYADDPVMANPARYGFTASISKPFTRAEFSDMLNLHLERARPM